MSMRAVLLAVVMSGLCPAAARAGDRAVGTATLTPCIAQYDGYCGSLSVPLDLRGGSGGTVTVGFELYRHTGAGREAGVILAQEGGPGYATTGSREGYLRLFAPLRADHDILLIDKRGTGRSSAIDCPALQAAAGPAPEATAACGRQLGRAAWFYRSVDAADDVADVLKALGYDHADFYGDSYGTLFGQVLAATHPGLLTTIVLDSAYPVADDPAAAADPADAGVRNGLRALDTSCRRSPSCATLGGTAGERLAALLGSLRAEPVTGPAPDQNGQIRTVTADAAGLFLILSNAGNAPTTWRDLDAAARALMQDGDGLPLLRLMAEAQGSNAGGGSPQSYSAGLADAVQCAETAMRFDYAAPPEDRERQVEAYVADLQARHPDVFSPFTVAEAADTRYDVEGYRSCIAWPRPPTGIVAGRALPPGTALPPVPTLVLSGEFDTVTPPKDGRAAAALFPDATFIETRNQLHESAIADEGVLVSPLGQDFSQCIGPIVRRFIATGGSTGDTSCNARLRPIRTVPAFSRSWAKVAPATSLAGNAVDARGLALASAGAETVGDVLGEFSVNQFRSGAGLRGGTFDIAATETGESFHLDGLRWTDDLAVDGDIDWNQLTGRITADVRLTAEGHAGAMRLTWDDLATDAVATLSGTVDGAALAATRLAP